jgi:hypothetical protein
MFRTCRPAGRLFYLVLVVGLSLRVAAREEGSDAKMEKPTGSAAARATAAKALPGASAPTPQGGPTLTSVVDTVYLADGTTAHGVLLITWPAFVETSGSAVSEGSLNVTLGTNGALNVALAPNAGANPPGVYYSVVYQLGPAVAARDIVNPEAFRDGISKIIDGTVECLNASTWCKQTPPATSLPSA